MTSPKKLHEKIWFLITAVAFLGPLAIPLIWKNPGFSVKVKTVSSLAILALTAFLIYLSKVVLVEFINP